MSGLHYTKSGALDMRYSSSRAAQSSGGYSSGNNGSGMGYGLGMAYNYSPSLNHKKDGSLDMRYSSSKAAVSSGGYSSGNNGSTMGYGIGMAFNDSPGLNHKKDGSLDMRYSSSKAAVADGFNRGYSSGTSRNINNSYDSSSGLNFKKDGSLDMRYRSSKAAVVPETSGYARPSGSRTSPLNYKKDGGLDMRFTSSKAATSNLTKTMDNMSISKPKNSSIPSYVPLTKRGLPDMRTNAAKNWVAAQAANCPVGDVPTWLPTLKDNCIDITKAVVQEFLRSTEGHINYDKDQRTNYYCRKMDNDSAFSDWVHKIRNQDVPDLSETNYSQTAYKSSTSLKSLLNNKNENITTQLRKQPCLEIKNQDITFSDVELGRGAFGVVIKGVWQGKEVAVKKMHLQSITVKEKKAFLTEVVILSSIKHDNLVELYGFTLDPLGLVLEFVKLGSLNHLLHYNEEPEIMAKITDGRIKKALLVGIARGMLVLHQNDIVHGDLKPHNILINNEFMPKITDFGLASLRVKTTSTIATSKLLDDDKCMGGTAAYMAVELLDSSEPPELSSDVYSFGILMNELIAEEEPYCDKLKNFLGRGPFGAVNYAKMGNRPTMRENTPSSVANLIRKCWDGQPSKRPNFNQIIEYLSSTNMIIPNFF